MKVIPETRRVHKLDVYVVETHGSTVSLLIKHTKFVMYFNSTTLEHFYISFFVNISVVSVSSSVCTTSSRMSVLSTFTSIIISSFDLHHVLSMNTQIDDVMNNPPIV